LRGSKGGRGTARARRTRGAALQGSIQKATRRRGPTEAELIAAARLARDHACADYSGFAVGAALETDDGLVITGCNIENATYGLTMCAERVALYNALSAGFREFRRLAVVADSTSPAPPCGACRQLIEEFAPKAEVVAANLGRRIRRWQAGTLLPDPFTRRLLDGRSSRRRRTR
jgi:cytidine deaminase